MKHSKELLSGDKLSLLANRQKRSAQDPSDVHGGGSGKHDDMLSKLQTLSNKHGGSSARHSFQSLDEHDRLSVKSDDTEDGLEDSEGRRSRPYTQDYLDVTSLSSASRRSAAPHIFNIYEQIFIDGTDAAQKRFHVPELPEEVQSSMRPTKYDFEAELGIVGTRVEATLYIAESWDHLTAGKGDKSMIEKQVVADLAVSLRTDKSRLRVADVRPSKDKKGVEVSILIMPSVEEDEHDAVQIGERLQQESQAPNSILRSMNSTRRLVRVSTREIKAAGSAGAESIAGGYPSLLRSGVVMDDRSVRPSLSAVHGQVPTELRVGNDKYASKEYLDWQQREREEVQQIQQARTAQDGFWVDVEAGNQQEKRQTYGTFRQKGEGRKVCFHQPSSSSSFSPSPPSPSSSSSPPSISFSSSSSSSFTSSPTFPPSSFLPAPPHHSVQLPPWVWQLLSLAAVIVLCMILCAIYVRFFQHREGR